MLVKLFVPKSIIIHLDPSSKSALTTSTCCKIFHSSKSPNNWILHSKIHQTVNATAPFVMAFNINCLKREIWIFSNLISWQTTDSERICKLVLLHNQYQDSPQCKYCLGFCIGMYLPLCSQWFYVWLICNFTQELLHKIWADISK